MFRTLVIYDDAARLIANNISDKDRVKDYSFKDINSISFIYPPLIKVSKWKKRLFSILPILVLFIPYFNGEVNLSFPKEIIEIHFILKNGDVIVHQESFESREEAKLSEEKLLAIFEAART